MKKRSLFGVTLAVISLFLMLGLAAGITYYNKDILFQEDIQTVDSTAALFDALHQAPPPPKEVKPEEPKAETTVPEEPQKNAIVTVKPADEADQEPESESEFVPAGDPSYIWVGDSRTVSMGRAMKNSDLYIGADGEGYEWLTEKGASYLEKALVSYPSVPVVLNMGVNDCANIDNYLRFYQELVNSYPTTHFYFESVNPIEPTLCETVSNEEISAFNTQIKNAFPDQYIDCFTFLMVSETVTIDGVHYSEEDSQKIYNFVSAQVNMKEAL